MSILDAIEEANTNAGIKHLSFAQLQEFNAFKDSFTFLEYPRNVVVPYALRGVIKNNRKKKIIPLQGWVLTRLRQDTNDFRSLEIEPDYIQPMRALAEKFIVQLLETDVTDSEQEDVSYSINPEYMFLDAHLFGVSYTVNWPVHGKIC